MFARLLARQGSALLSMLRQKGLQLPVVHMVGLARWGAVQEGLVASDGWMY